tara:strand:+ start:369 stop:491 length:123 start_codon:yes stop_codon:yes gene_type:complete
MPSLSLDPEAIRAVEKSLTLLPDLKFVVEDDLRFALEALT